MSCKNSTKFYFSAEEDEKLIEEVSTHPALYDLQDPNYKDQKVKDNIWVVVGEEVGRPGTYIFKQLYDFTSPLN